MINRRSFLVVAASPAFASCESRNFESPKNLMIGHWVRADQRMHLFCDGQKRTFVDISGMKMSWSYAIARENILERVVQISAEIPAFAPKDYKGRKHTFQFSLDARTMKEDVVDYVGEKEFRDPTTTWLYLDSSTAPKP
jgi:hypothetical protein